GLPERLPLLRLGPQTCGGRGRGGGGGAVGRGCERGGVAVPLGRRHVLGPRTPVLWKSLLNGRYRLRNQLCPTGFWCSGCTNRKMSPNVARRALSRRTVN